MATRREHDTDFEFQDPGFSAFCHRPNQSVAHRHDDLELCVNEHGGGVALFGGQKVTFIPDRLVVMWGAIPHKPLETDPITVAYGIRVPMHWVLQWKLPDTLTRRLLNFDVIVDRRCESPCSDLRLLKHWVLLMQSGRREDREIVLLEVHARLLRLADTIAATDGKAAAGAVEPSARQPPACGLFERILRIVSERYREPLSIPTISRELHISRTHVMRQFRKVAGITLLEYMTQQRVSCAQRLMITTDAKILDIALESGFGSLGQFYACFKRITGQSPARYRRILRR
jgi:AraC-like DNA-binding protein